MRALVMAAGLGTRLKPLTDTLPKPLVKVLGRPMIEYVLDVLAAEGFREAMVNVHYLPEKLRAFVAEWNGRGGPLRLFVQDESKQILGSGGAVALAGKWLVENEGTALVCNADGIAQPKLRNVIQEHARLEREQVDCTLALMAYPGAGEKYNGARFANGKISGFERPGRADPGLFHFFGYYLLSKACLGRLPPAGQVGDTLKDLWVPLAREGRLGGWKYDGIYHDLGSVEDLRAAEAELKSRRR
jgi:MurNAc alpha-1-phosphate uridylyltransferase